MSLTPLAMFDPGALATRFLFFTGKGGVGKTTLAYWIVGQARSRLVILDTAPTGHTLLLLDATGAYHKDVLRGAAPSLAGKLVTPLMRLRDPSFTRLLLVTLPETTPVSEAATLQEDLRRAGIEPFGWVVNASLAAAGPRDPLLRAGSRSRYARSSACAGWRRAPSWSHGPPSRRTDRRRCASSWLLVHEPALTSAGEDLPCVRGQAAASWRVE